MTGTNLWTADTPPQSLPVEDNIIYSPGVKVGDWANYTLQVIINPYDPDIPYDGPKNSTINVEILNVVESNVTFSLTIEEEGNVETDKGWIDVSTGNSSPDMKEIKGIIAANLTVGDALYPDFNEVISDTQVTNIFGADRILNLIEWPDGDYSWDRSSGVLVGMNVNYHMEMDEPDPYSDPGFEPNPRGIYIWDGDRSYVNETDEEWTIQITGRFNGTLTPMGPYHVNLEVYNSNHDWIDFGYLAWEANQSPHRMIAVGKPGLSSSGYYETWTFQKLDLENGTLIVARTEKYYFACIFDLEDHLSACRRLVQKFVSKFETKFQEKIHCDSLLERAVGNTWKALEKKLLKHLK